AVQGFVTDLEFVEIRGGEELPRLDLVAYPFRVALVGQEIAVVVMNKGYRTRGCLSLDNAPARVMLEGTLLTGIQDIGFVEIARAHFPRHEGPTLVVYFLKDVASAVAEVSLPKLSVPMHFYEQIS